MKSHSRCGEGVRLGAEVLLRFPDGLPGRQRGVVVGHGQYEHEWLVRVYQGNVEAVHVEDLEAIG